MSQDVDCAATPSVEHAREATADVSDAAWWCPHRSIGGTSRDVDFVAGLMVWHNGRVAWHRRHGTSSRSTNQSSRSFSEPLGSSAHAQNARMAQR